MEYIIYMYIYMHIYIYIYIEYNNTTEIEYNSYLSLYQFLFKGLNIPYLFANIIRYNL